MPEYIILAGVNGAGKSTLYRSLLSSDKNYALINADEILQSMHGYWHSDLDNLKASCCRDIMLSRRRRLLQAGREF